MDLSFHECLNFYSLIFSLGQIITNVVTVVIAQSSTSNEIKISSLCNCTILEHVLICFSIDYGWINLFILSWDP